MYFSAVVARYLAEGLVAVDDGVVDDLSIGQYEAAVGCKRGYANQFANYARLGDQTRRLEKKKDDFQAR